MTRPLYLPFVREPVTLIFARVERLGITEFQPVNPTAKGYTRFARIGQALDYLTSQHIDWLIEQGFAVEFQETRPFPYARKREAGPRHIDDTI